MTKWNLAPLLILCVFILTACQGGTAPPSLPPPQPPTATPAPTPDPTPPPDPAEEALAAMSTEEKVGQLFIVGFEGTTPGDDVTSYLQDLHAGGVILFKRNVERAAQLVSLTNDLKALNTSAVPLFVGVDQEGGTVERMPPEIKRLPSAYALNCGKDDYGRALLLGEVLAAECAAFGFNLDFAPSADVWSNPNNTVIGKRAFSSDPEIAANAAVVCAQGLQNGGVIPVLKHFPGHGDTDTDSHVGLPVVTKSREEWEQFEFLPFRTAMDNNRLSRTLMISHILLTAMDDVYPATLSHQIVTEFLREEQGFDGVLFTDDMTMGAITKNYGLGEACVLSVEAGCDVLLVCHGRENIEASYRAVLEAVQSGRISEARLDESVLRILRLKIDFALTGAPVPPADIDALNAKVAEAWSALGQ